MKRFFLVFLFLMVAVSCFAEPYELPAGSKTWAGWKSDFNKIFKYFGATAGEPEAEPTIIGPLNVIGDGDSWFELENNTAFTDSLTGKYGIRFYNGVLQQIINGTASALGSGVVDDTAYGVGWDGVTDEAPSKNAVYDKMSTISAAGAPTVQTDDPTLSDDTGWYLATTSGDSFYVIHGVGVFTMAGSYAGDTDDPVLVAGADSTHDGTTAVNGSVELTEDNPASPAVTFTATGCSPTSGSCTGTYPDYVTPDLTPSGTDDVVVTFASTDLAGNTATGTDLVQEFAYDAGAACADESCSGFIACQNYEGTGFDNSESYSEYLAGGGASIDEDSTTSPLRGSQSLRMYAGTTGNFAWLYRIFGATITSGSLHFRFRADDATPPVVQSMLAAFRTTGGNDDIGIAISNTGHLIGIHGTTVTTGSATISDATAYHVWADFANGAGSGTLRVYVSTTVEKPATADITITTGTNNTALERFGFWSQATMTLDYDQLLIHADEIGDVCE